MQIAFRTHFIWSPASWRCVWTESRITWDAWAQKSVTWFWHFKTIPKPDSVKAMTRHYLQLRSDAWSQYSFNPIALKRGHRTREMVSLTCGHVHILMQDQLIAYWPQQANKSPSWGFNFQLLTFGWKTSESFPPAGFTPELILIKWFRNGENGKGLWKNLYAWKEETRKKSEIAVEQRQTNTSTEAQLTGCGAGVPAPQSHNQLLNITHLRAASAPGLFLLWSCFFPNPGFILFIF